MDAQVLTGGFSDPAIQAASAFRAVMEAMARPGTIFPITGAVPPAPLSPAAGAVLLTLCDADTSVYLAGAMDCKAVRTWLAFHTGASVVGPAVADFAVGAWDDLGALSQYPVGTSEYPDRSTTLVIELAEMNATGATLAGPGIQTTAQFSLPDVKSFQANNQLFPLGLDFIFTSGDDVAALPRSTQVS